MRAHVVFHRSVISGTGFVSLAAPGLNQKLYERERLRVRRLPNRHREYAARCPTGKRYHFFRHLSEN
jgi:hypothetical protein